MTGRTVSAAVLLIIGAGLALLAVLVHYGFTSVYGDVTDSALDALTWGLTAGPSGLAFGLVAMVAVISLMLSTGRWMRLNSVAIPVLMLIAMFAVTPLAVGQKLEVQFDSAPRCVSEGTDEPMASADRESQRGFNSISHVDDASANGILMGCDQH